MRATPRRSPDDPLAISFLPMSALVDLDYIALENSAGRAALEDEYDSLGRQLERRGIAIDAIRKKVAAFSVAIPSWGVGRGGTRFARFPFPGEPTSIHEKLQDCAIVQQLSTLTPRASLH